MAVAWLLSLSEGRTVCSTDPALCTLTTNLATFGEAEDSVPLLMLR